MYDSLIWINVNGKSKLGTKQKNNKQSDSNIVVQDFHFMNFHYRILVHTCRCFFSCFLIQNIWSRFEHFGIQCCLLFQLHVSIQEYCITLSVKIVSFYVSDYAGCLLLTQFKQTSGWKLSNIDWIISKTLIKKVYQKAVWDIVYIFYYINLHRLKLSN